ncbi:MAG: DUF6122 family protein [Erythrobacter sp.]
METLQPIIHYGGHWIAPFLIAAILWQARWKVAGFVIASANLIDLDHLLATPMFDPNRCSVGFHFLHGWEAAAVYALMLLIPRWYIRAFAIGAFWHLIVDYGDCRMMLL